MAGFLRIVSPDELSEKERADDKRREARDKELQDDEFTTGLANYIRTQWAIARDHRSSYGMEQRLLKAMRMFNGEYDPEDLAEIRRFGGSEVFARLVGAKCRAATALLRDVFFSTERPWELAATPAPDLPQDAIIMVENKLLDTVRMSAMQGLPPPSDEVLNQLRRQFQEEARGENVRLANEEAKKAEAILDDYLVEGGFYKALCEFLVDLPLFPFACIKGPVVRVVPQIKWNNGIPEEQSLPRLFWYRVSPFDLFWTPGVSSVADGDVFERLRWTRKNLHDLLGLPGWNQDAVKAALAEYDHGLRDWMMPADAERAREEGREDPNFNRSNMIDALEFHGSVMGVHLQEWGLGDIEDDKDYFVQAWLVGDYVLKVHLAPSPRKRHPYFVTSFDKVPGTVAGNALPDILSDVQQVANATLRSLVNNMSIACLPADTVVYRWRSSGSGGTGKHEEITIGELWSKKHQKNSGLRRIKLRSVDEGSGRLFGNRIVDIVQNGVQPVFRVRTARGYTIRATANHRFMSDDGVWRELECFFLGDNIAVNGAASASARVCADCDAPLSKKPTAVRCKSCAAKRSIWNRKQAIAALNNREASETTARGRKLVRVHKKHACEKCGVTDRQDLVTLGLARNYMPRALHIHHVDGDPYNADVDNLMTLCAPCHKEWHVRHGNFGNPRKHRFMDYDRITAIEYAGDEMTYDLQMTAPNHNFIADGFVVHNSGPQVVIMDNRADPLEDTDELYPWKRWHMNDEPGQSTSVKPVDFFQPNSNAQELLHVYQQMTMIADELSAIPRYITGSGATGGAGRTASGLSMLMGNANKMLHNVVANIDEDVVHETIQSLYELVMLTRAGSIPLHGDEEIRTRGVATAMAREAERARQLEFLGVTANPIDMQITGIEGRAAVLRQVAADLGMPGEEVVPSREQFAQRQRQALMAQQAQAQVGGGAERPSNPAESTSPRENVVQPRKT